MHIQNSNILWIIHDFDENQNMKFSKNKFNSFSFIHLIAYRVYVFYLWIFWYCVCILKLDDCEKIDLLLFLLLYSARERSHSIF